MMQILSSRYGVVWLLALGCGALLVGALVFEYGFGLAPCPLCLLQRWPHVAVIVVFLGAYFFMRNRDWFWPLALMVLILAGSGAFGFYHAGIEWKFWEGPAACSGSGSFGDFDQFQNALAGSVAVSCTEAAWRLLGLSLAGWNGVFSFVLMVLGLRGLAYGSSSESQ